MLYYLLYPLHESIIGLGVMRYITFRTFAATFTAMAIYFLFGQRMINFIRGRQFWQTVRDDGPVTHMDKRGTPTMGGVLLWIAILVSSLLWSRFLNPLVWLGLLMSLAYGMIGFLDDYWKIVRHDAKGLRGRYKFSIQVVIAVVVGIVLFGVLGLEQHLSIPFFKSVTPNLGAWYVVFAMFVIVGASNAVNLTDGLDGLVSMPSIIAFLAFCVLAYVAGNAKISGYLGVPNVPGAGELAVVCGAVVGGCIGFLWFNAHPASIFMGDVGSLPLGALLGYVALVTKNEILLVIIGGIFVLETISVIAQVISFQLTGKRVFRMAPLHHHFELKGWPETKVIVRFWIIAFVLAIASLATLKLR